MKVKVLLMVFIFIGFAFILSRSFLSADTKEPVRTRLVLIHGETSKLLKGDALKADRIGPGKFYYGDDVLPRLLAQGWKIDSVHLSECSEGKDPTGYVVIVK